MTRKRISVVRLMAGFVALCPWLGYAQSSSHLGNAAGILDGITPDQDLEASSQEAFEGQQALMGALGSVEKPAVSAKHSGDQEGAPTVEASEGSGRTEAPAVPVPIQKLTDHGFNPSDGDKGKSSNGVWGPLGRVLKRTGLAALVSVATLGVTVWSMALGVWAGVLGVGFFGYLFGGALGSLGEVAGGGAPVANMMAGQGAAAGAVMGGILGAVIAPIIAVSGFQGSEFMDWVRRQWKKGP